MYLPAVFSEVDLTTLHDFIERHDFGVLVSQVDSEPFASHLPFLLERASGERGTLVAHVARDNPQWEQISGQTALAIFSGPHAYVSPGWYESAPAVPTWNYTAVHVSGRVEAITDPDELWGIVGRLVARHEAHRPAPWSLADDAEFARRLLPQIVGLRLKIDRIEGKSKLSQNRPLEQRLRVIRALREAEDENSRAVAELMDQALPTGTESAPRGS
jgi:transcriptional regulator